MLQASERDLPGDYNPPSRLAVAYLAMKKPDEALAASNRALPKVIGPRRIRVLQTRSEIFTAMGDAAASREALEQALAYAESLPAGQRSEGTIEALKKKLEVPPAKPPARSPSGEAPLPDGARARAPRSPGRGGRGHRLEAPACWRCAARPRSPDLRDRLTRSPQPARS
jgi:tetratricopeptide (TPR) repeat protein